MSYSCVKPYYKGTTSWAIMSPQTHRTSILSSATYWYGVLVFIKAILQCYTLTFANKPYEEYRLHVLTTGAPFCDFKVVYQTEMLERNPTIVL